MTQARTFDYRDLVHSPTELAVEYVNWAQRIHTTPGVPFGIPAVDKAMIPMHPGDVGAILGRPGHGKTSLLCYLARAEAKNIAKRGGMETECVVYVTWEQVAEEIENIFELNPTYTPSDVAWGRANMHDVIANANKRGRLPVWVIGHSLARSDIRMPRMTTDVVFKAIESMQQEYHVKPVLVCLDYIQIIPIERPVERVAQVTEVAIRVKELAMRIGAPIWVGVQARREVDDQAIKIPQPRDAQWASSIEQTVDKLFGVWRPWLTERGTETVNINGAETPVTEELLVMEMSKQRFEKAGFVWPLHFAPQYLSLCEYELRHQHEPPEWMDRDDIE